MGKTLTQPGHDSHQARACVEGRVVVHILSHSWTIFFPTWKSGGMRLYTSQDYDLPNVHHLHTSHYVMYGGGVHFTYNSAQLLQL